jgi:hypothetical protein
MGFALKYISQRFSTEGADRHFGVEQRCSHLPLASLHEP